MNKAELIEKVATEVGITKAQTEKLLDCTMDTIKKAVKKGDEVKLVGFGTFVKAKRKARTGRNPQTGRPPAQAPHVRQKKGPGLPVLFLSKLPERSLAN